MARAVDRVWVRFGLGIAATVLVTMGLLAGSVMAFAEWQYRSFYRSLPSNLQQELRQLQEEDQEGSPRAAQIYAQHGRGDLLFGEKWALFIGLVFCVPVGLGVGFWISRIVTLPLASMAEAANRIAMGDLTVRAEAGGDRGEMAEMVRDFNRMTDALQALESERKTTAAALSHELRTPLAVLTARIHALRDGVIPLDGAEFDRLLAQVAHLSRLVEDMHTLALADAARLSLHIGEVDVAGLASDVIDVYGGRAAQAGVALELAAQQDVRIHSDEDRLRQVISNLVDNALRHARGASRVEVAVSRDGAEAVLAVSDDGCGLPDEVRRRPFERFQRAGTARGPQGGGSGLGLSIVQALVASLGGSVQAGERPGGGACFTVRLPVGEPGRPGSAQRAG